MQQGCTHKGNVIKVGEEISERCPPDVYFCRGKPPYGLHLKHSQEFINKIIKQSARMRQPIQINRSPETSFTEVAKPSSARKGECRRTSLQSRRTPRWRRRNKRASFNPKRRGREGGGQSSLIFGAQKPDNQEQKLRSSAPDPKNQELTTHLILARCRPQCRRPRTRGAFPRRWGLGRHGQSATQRDRETKTQRYRY